MRWACAHSFNRRWWRWTEESRANWSVRIYFFNQSKSIEKTSLEFTEKDFCTNSDIPAFTSVMSDGILKLSTITITKFSFNQAIRSISIEYACTSQSLSQFLLHTAKHLSHPVTFKNRSVYPIFQSLERFCSVSYWVENWLKHVLWNGPLAVLPHFLDILVALQVSAVQMQVLKSGFSCSIFLHRYFSVQWQGIRCIIPTEKIPESHHLFIR